MEFVTAIAAPGASDTSRGVNATFRNFCAMLVALCLQASSLAATFHVAPNGNDAANGSAGSPWRTIQRAVSDWKPGDTVLVASGIYRERIEVKRGGSENAPVTLAAAPGAEVVVTGADVLADGWSAVADGVFSREWAHRFPIGGHDELTHPGDEGHKLIGRAEQVVADGRLLRQVLRREQLEADTFFVDLDAKKLLVRLRDNTDPSRAAVEASVRTQWLAVEMGVSDVRVRGITFRYAANHAQRGAFIMGHESARWSIEGCTFERANGPGATFTGGGHVVRRCVFQDNGQLGFGAWACHDTRLEECVLARNNTKGYSTAWEAGGCKITMSRGFAVHRSRAMANHGPGIWYDIGNEKSEVAHCHIADNDEAGIFYEISYGLHAHDNVVVNNANQSPRPPGAWGFGGITLSSSEDCVVENNTLTGNRDGISFREQKRTTPRISGGGEVRVLNRNHTLRRNVIADSREFGIGFWMDTTFFGPHPNGNDKNDPIFEDPKTLNFRFDQNVLTAPPDRANYIYGCKWRAKSRTANTPAEFTALSGITDTSVAATAQTRDAAAARLGAGAREISRVPAR